MKYAKLLILIVFLTGCNMFSAGTLGAFQQWTFHVSEKRFDNEIATFYKNNPTYIIPYKWKELDNWNESGYGSLRGKIIYFKNGPEQMYYISYFEAEANPFDSITTTIAVRAVNSGNKLIVNKADSSWISNKWHKRDDFDEREAKNIDERFYKEIISKLERQIGQKAQRKDT